MQKIRRAGYLLILVFAGGLCVSFLWKPAARPRFHGLDAADVPMSIGGYQGRPAPLDAVTIRALSTAQIASRSYTDKSGNTIGLLMIGGTNRDALHDPRSCLTGSGGVINADHLEQLPGSSSAAAGSIAARSCVVTYPPGSQYGSGYDILYFYVSNRKIISSPTEIRMALLRALVDGGGGDDAPVYFIRIATHYTPGGGFAAEHTRLTQFASTFWKECSPLFLEENRS